MHSAVQTTVVTIISYKPLSGLNFARYTDICMPSSPLGSISPWYSVFMQWNLWTADALGVQDSCPLTSWPHPQSYAKRFNTGNVALQEAESANFNQTCSEEAKIDKEWTDYLSKKCPKLDLIFMICARGFGLRLLSLSEVILYRYAGCPLSRV